MAKERPQLPGAQTGPHRHGTHTGDECIHQVSPVRCIWSVWFIWLIWFDQTNKTNQINEIDRTIASGFFESQSGERAPNQRSERDSMLRINAVGRPELHRPARLGKQENARQDAQKGQTSHPPNPGAPRRALSLARPQRVKRRGSYRLRLC